jgi:hypothetical protein
MFVKGCNRLRSCEDDANQDSTHPTCHCTRGCRPLKNCDLALIKSCSIAADLILVLILGLRTSYDLRQCCPSFMRGISTSFGFSRLQTLAYEYTAIDMVLNYGSTVRNEPQMPVLLRQMWCPIVACMAVVPVVTVRAGQRVDVWCKCIFPLAVTIYPSRTSA